MSIPFIDLKNQYEELKQQIDARIKTVLEHGQYIMGPEVQELEKKLQSYTGAKHCITVASGTEALLISLMALGVKSGDEIITTPFTFISTVEVIVLLGAKPVFVDIDFKTCNIDASLIEAAITPNTKAIIPVSLYGQPADMDEINCIAQKHGGIPVIEDAAQSFGASYKGNKSCNLSTIGCTSFFPSKPLGCYGDGGAIFTSDDTIAQACREIRVHGQSKRYFHSRVGVGGRMDTLQCAIVLAKLERFEWEVTQRYEVALRYHSLLTSKKALDTSSPGISCFSSEALHPLPLPKEGRTSVFAQWTILVNNRDTIQQKLKAAGIPTAVHYPVPVNKQPAYSHFHSVPTPIAQNVAERVMSLPMGPDLPADRQRYIVEQLISASEKR